MENTQSYFLAQRYQILGELGQGGMGKVYKVQDIRLNRIVALKMFLKNFNSDVGSIKRFFEEAHLASNLKHPNIIAIYDIGTDQDQNFFIMEWVDGESLQDLLKRERKKTSFKRWVKILSKVCDAMDYAHSMGIIHRDLKPANIMIKEKDEPVIMDFGIAKALYKESKLTRTGEIFGTLNYMSPEQANGMRREIDAQSDVYSLGAILYEILTGICPFHGFTPMEILSRMANQSLSTPRSIQPHIPKSLECVCLKAMAFQKYQRYRSARELKEDLELYLEGKPVKANPAFWNLSSSLNRKIAIACSLCFLAISLFMLFMLREAANQQPVKKSSIPKPVEKVSLPKPKKPALPKGVWAEFVYNQSPECSPRMKFQYNPHIELWPVDMNCKCVVLPIDFCFMFSFILPEFPLENKVFLKIENLSAADDSIKGQNKPGYSPVSIEINGALLEKSYHPKSWGLVEKIWTIDSFLIKGENFIVIKPVKPEYRTVYYLHSARIILE